MNSVLILLLALITIAGSAQSRFEDDHIKRAGYFYVDYEKNWFLNTGKVSYRMEDINQDPLAYDFGEWHDSLAYYRMQPKGKPKKAVYGYMDIYMTPVIPPTYKSASNFYNGVALVSDGERSFYIDKTGAEITEAQAKAAGFEQVYDKMVPGAGIYDSISPTPSYFNRRRVYVGILEKDEAKALARKEKAEKKIKDKKDLEKYLKKARIEFNKKEDSIWAREKRAREQHTANLCSACGGTGVSGVGTLQCGNCGGSGGTSCAMCGGTGRSYSSDRTNSQYCSSCAGMGKKTCSSCNGTGKRKIQGARCPVCSGTGRKQ